MIYTTSDWKRMEHMDPDKPVWGFMFESSQTKSSKPSAHCKPIKGMITYKDNLKDEIAIRHLPDNVRKKNSVTVVHTLYHLRKTQKPVTSQNLHGPKLCMNTTAILPTLKQKLSTLTTMLYRNSLTCSKHLSKKPNNI